MQIVALSGKAGTGKDYLYTHVLQPLGFHRVALADHFKNWIVGRGLATYEDVYVTKPEHVRWMLQQEGTELGRKVYGDDVWCRTLSTWMHHWEATWGMSKFAVTDVRFPNEVEFVQQLGGKVYRIEAPDRAARATLPAALKEHISETALDAFRAFDGIIHNDPVDQHTVSYEVRELLVGGGMVSAATAFPPTDFRLGV